MPGNTLTRPNLRRAHLAGVALVLVCSGALAAPDEGADALDRYIADNQLAAPAAPAPAPTLAGRVHDKASDMVLAAMNFLGVPYRRGGNGGNGGDAGFDCSGFTRHIFEVSLGLPLPRRVDDQASAPGLVKVQRDDLKPGDLVFFNTLKRTFSHVGIYIGEGRFIHSPRSGGQVRVEDMRYAYWNKRYTGARRAEPLLASAPAVPAAESGVAPTGTVELTRVLY
jgi:cell wall-associated NlpC family hydrolase